MPLSSPNSAKEPRSGELHIRLLDSRAQSLELAQPLSDEDQTVQAMDDASPTKWHLAHTTWFYEAFLLRKHLEGYTPYSDAFDYCFNSYYETAGERHPRASRGLLTRPSAAEVRDYRAHVDDALQQLSLSQAWNDPQVEALVELGINHEQQHQELLLTDILALFSLQPLRPTYQSPRPREVTPETTRGASKFISFEGGICDIGHDGNGFSYDNEGPRHRTLINPFRLAASCVTNAEWLEFIADGCYSDPLLWLADGWATVKENGWQAPGYWQREGDDGDWRQMTLEGLQPLDLDAPVSHVSYYEADAFGRWAGKRLPTEFEWELASASVPLSGNTAGSRAFRPRPAAQPPTAQNGLQQMFGDVWEWTGSAYLPYPGYRPPAGAIGEYNGKFMCSQQVLKGASCATADGHSRRSYRNFFYPGQRWQFMGLRLAEDAT